MSASHIEPDILFEFLRKSFLFQNVEDERLAQIIEHLEFVNYKKGEAVVLENEVSDHVWFVYSGSVEVVKNIPELNQLNRLAVLKSGSQFSEFSVLNRANKSASVFTLEDSEFLRISGDNFLAILQTLPVVTRNLVLQLASATHYAETSQFRVEYFSEDEIDFQPRLIEIVNPKLWKKFGVLPLKYENRCLYIAAKNPRNNDFFQFIKNSHPNLHINVRLINETDFAVLESQLLQIYKMNRPAQSKAAVNLLPEPWSGQIDEWLVQVSIFKDFPQEWRQQLSEHINIKNLGAGEIIYKMGEPSGALYLIVSGFVNLNRPLACGNASLSVATIGPGEYFSEVSLLADQPHALSARAHTPVTLALIDKQVILHLLDTPGFTIPLACDLSIQFQKLSSGAHYKDFDPKLDLHLEKLAGLIPSNIMLEHQILPLRIKDNELTLGITNPESTSVYEVVGRYLNKHRVTIELIQTRDFLLWFEQINSFGSMPKASLSGVQKFKAQAKKIPSHDVVSVLNQIVMEGFHSGASDVHIEPSDQGFSLRYRVDGVLREGNDKYHKDTGEEIIGRIKIMSEMDTTQRFQPQDGQMKLEVEGNILFARVSTLPTKHGEKAVLRLIRERGSVPQLSMLTPDKRVLRTLNDVVNSRQGVFLVTGPTGSGKSTTLYSLIQELNKVEICIVSLEDPVEMEIQGTTQVEINEKVNLSFAKALRSALRQDPDVIVLGEIRDEESAKIAFHAAATGHLVISTLHTNDSLGVLPRLRELGISKGSLSSNLIGASAQRLMRQICKECRDLRPTTSSEAELIKIELKSELVPSQLAYGRGCPKCSNSGFSGRIPIIEIWQKTKEIETLLQKSDSEDELRQVCQEQEFETLREIAIKMAVHGYSTLDEALRVVGGFQIVSGTEKRKSA